MVRPMVVYTGRTVNVQPTLFVVFKMAEWLARLVLCARLIEVVDRGSSPRSDHRLAILLS